MFPNEKKLVSELSLSNVEFQSHTFKITKWIALHKRVVRIKNTKERFQVSEK